MSPQLLLIGAGPVGLAVGKALLEAGITPHWVERTAEVGGNWSHGVYESAHIISSRKTTEYPDWPMPSTYPDFPSARQMKAYYEGYADHFGLRRHIRFGVEVDRVEHANVTPDDHRGWRVTFSGGESQRLDGVIVCNGHHWSRAFPAWVSRATTPILHSKDYRRADQLAGKRVLVVGLGNSACDIAASAARVSASATWSVHRGVHLLPKSFLGIPVVELMTPWLPVPLQRALLATATRVKHGPYARFGLPRPERRVFDDHPTLNDEIWHPLAHGRLQVRPGIREVAGEVVTFVDGSEDRYDLIVCATGYQVDFPFLPPGLVPVVGKTPQVIGGMLVPGQRHLYIVGAFQPRYGLGPLVRPSAELLARWVHLQESIDEPLADVLVRLGVRPPTTHLVNPHAALAQIRRARRLEPLIRRAARRQAG